MAGSRARLALACLAQIVLLAAPLSGELYLPSWLSSDSGATIPVKKPMPTVHPQVPVFEGTPRERALQQIDWLVRTTQHGADVGTKIVFMTFSNYYFKDFLENWLFYVHRFGLSSIMVGTMDKETEQLCASKSLAFHDLEDPVLLDTPLLNKIELARQGTGDFRQSEEGFRNMGIKKVALLLALTELGYEVVMSDTDAVWMADPRPWLMGHIEPWTAVSDVIVSSDCLSPTADRQIEQVRPGQMRHPRGGVDGRWWHLGPAQRDGTFGNLVEAAFNTGVIFFRSNVASNRLAADWAYTIYSKGKDLPGGCWFPCDDQQALNVITREGTVGKKVNMIDPLQMVDGGSNRVWWAHGGQVRLGIFPVELFSNGHTFYVQQAGRKAGLQTYSVHNTFIPHANYGKKYRFRSAHLWDADPLAYFTEGKFLVYSSVVPEAVHGPGPPTLLTHMRIVTYHFHQLRNAFALAKALGRILVMPRFLCHCDWYWFDTVAPGCRTPGSEINFPAWCPLDHFVNLDTWGRFLDMDKMGPWREESFLDNPRFPPEVLASRATVMVGDGAPWEGPELGRSIASELGGARRLAESRKGRAGQAWNASSGQAAEGAEGVLLGRRPLQAPGQTPGTYDDRAGGIAKTDGSRLVVRLRKMPTESQLRADLEAVEDRRVLEFTSTHDAFCKFDDPNTNAEVDKWLSHVLNFFWCCPKEHRELKYSLPPPLAASTTAGDALCRAPPYGPDQSWAKAQRIMDEEWPRRHVDHRGGVLFDHPITIENLQDWDS